MRTLRTINRPTKALLMLLIPALYLLVLNKSLWFILYLTCGMTTKEYANSDLVVLLNIASGLFFLWETIVFLYIDKKKTNHGY